jgi:two-component system sensor kinase FixL
VALASDLAPVLVDKVQIGQVVLNIVRNAIEAMEASAERALTITTAGCADGVKVTIADTGPGLPPQVAARLFQPFVTTKAKGMGLGLAICHDIVDSHGGSLCAAPNQPSGTVFLIRLPVIDGGEVR